ncbi:hypothetical protein ES702_03825 [subsurface metagenome]
MVTEPGRDKDSRGKFIKGNTAALKSGCGSFLIRGRLPQVRGIKRLRGELQELKKRLEEDISNINVKQQILIDNIVKAHGYSLLFEAHCKRVGLFTFKRKEINYMPGFAVYQTFQNQIRHSIRALNDSQDRGNDKPQTIVEMLKSEGEKNEQNQDNRRS